MLRISEECWIKASAELEEKGCKLGAVVTNFGYSDWSTQDFPTKDGVIHLKLRMRKNGDDIIVDFFDEILKEWSQLRMAHVHQKSDTLEIGIYACSPIGEDCVVTFSSFRLILLK